MIPYTFVVLRYVHDVGAGEFANVGVVAWSDRTGLHFRVSDRYSRLSKFFADFDGLSYRRVIKHVEDRLRAEGADIRQADLLRAAPSDLISLVHGIVPRDDSALQWSPIMGGVTEDLDQRVDELFEELVLRHETKLSRERRDEQSIQRSVDHALTRAGVLGRLRRDVEVAGEDYEYSFYAGWSNGKLQVLEPISLDFVNPADMVEKANTWSGRLYNLARRTDFACTAIVARPTEEASIRRLDRAMAILRHAPAVRAVIPEEDMQALVDRIQQDLDG